MITYRCSTHVFEDVVVRIYAHDDLFVEAVYIMGWGIGHTMMAGYMSLEPGLVIDDVRQNIDHDTTSIKW